MIIPRTKPISRKRLEQLRRGASSKEYKAFRETVLERDEHACQFPGCKRCGAHADLEVHHIKRHAHYAHLRTDPKNGITLCREHHKKVTGFEEYYEYMFMKIVFAKMKYENES